MHNGLRLGVRFFFFKKTDAKVLLVAVVSFSANKILKIPFPFFQLLEGSLFFIN